MNFQWFSIYTSAEYLLIRQASVKTLRAVINEMSPKIVCRYCNFNNDVKKLWFCNCFNYFMWHTCVAYQFGRVHDNRVCTGRTSSRGSLLNWTGRTSRPVPTSTRVQHRNRHPLQEHVHHRHWRHHSTVRFVFITKTIDKAFWNNYELPSNEWQVILWIKRKPEVDYVNFMTVNA